MIRSKRWLEGTRPEQPLTEVARRALRERLATVWYYAPRAAKKADDPEDSVHQLRVASRRARAALRIFAELLPKREAQWIEKRLRRLRQAAGNARDLDVLGARLSQFVREKDGCQLQSVVEQIAAGRRKAQKPLVTAYKKAKRKGFKKRSRALARAVGWHRAEQEPTFAVAARATLAPLVDEFFVAADADLADIARLHKMRIHGKHVRYAMELLAGAFDDSFRDILYVTFEEIQERLGKINDHATAIAMLAQWVARSDNDSSRAELAGLIVGEEKQLNVECQVFRDWWTAERAADIKQRFARLLKTTGSEVAEDQPPFETTEPRSCKTLHQNTRSLWEGRSLSSGEGRSSSAVIAALGRPPRPLPRPTLPEGG